MIDKMAWIMWHWWETCLMSADKSVRSSSHPFLWDIFDSRNGESISIINRLQSALIDHQNLAESEA